MSVGLLIFPTTLGAVCFAMVFLFPIGIGSVPSETFKFLAISTAWS